MVLILECFQFRIWEEIDTKRLQLPAYGACDWCSYCNCMSRPKELIVHLPLAKFYSISSLHPQSFYMNYRQTVTLLFSLRKHENTLFHNLPLLILLAFSIFLSWLLILRKCIFFINDFIFSVKHLHETGCMNFE